MRRPLSHLKSSLKGFSKNPLLTGSIVLFVGTMVGNFGGYLYHLLMGRMLGPSDYGILVSLISVTYLISVFSQTLNTVVVKFTSSFKARGDYDHIKAMFREFNQKFLGLGVLIFLIFTLASGSIGDFLNISDRRAIILIGSTFLIRFLVPINNGLLQGFLNFSFLSLNGILAAILKVGVALILVKMGLSVIGALLGMAAADFLTYLFSFAPLKSFIRMKNKTVGVDWGKKFTYAVPTFLAVLSLTSLYSTDIILVKHFFDSHQAGLYSALGILGKIIFFASSAVTLVMFPMVTENYENGKKYQNLLLSASVLVGGISVLITLIYYIFPGLMVKLLYGPSYLEASFLLGAFGIFISLYSFSNLFVNFFLSIHKTKIAVFPLAAAIAQIALIYLFHNSLIQVIRISIWVTALLVLSLLVFYLKNEQSKA